MLLCWILLLGLGGHPANGFTIGPSLLRRGWSPLGPPTTKRQRRIEIARFLHRTVERSSSLVKEEDDSNSICGDDDDVVIVQPIQICQQQPTHHTVQGLECVAVTIGWPRIHQQQQQQQHRNNSNSKNNSNNINSNSNTKTVTIVEATARSQEVLVDQALENESTATRDSDVYGAVLWPAALVLAERLVLWLLSQQQPQQRYKILEVGAGTGLVSLAAARLGGAHSVLATDYHELPLQLLQYAAQHLNCEEDHDPDLDDKNNNNNLHTAHLDLCDYIKTPLPRPPPETPADDHNINNNIDDDDDFTLMVAADVLYEPATGVALAHRAVEALQRGMRVWIADSPGRAGRTALLQTLHELLDNDGDAPTVLTFRNVTGWTVTGERHELICGPHSRSVATNATTPQALDVAILELDPAQHRVAAAGYHRHTAPAVISQRS